MKMNGAEILTNVLIEQGVTDIFGYPGGAILHIYDAFYKYSDQLKHHLTAHEQGAAHAADGYARHTGKTGVVIATSGPGATNLVTGIATAFMDSIPMVAITGNVGNSLIGRDSFQEVYTMGITMPITKHNFIVQKIEDLAPTLREAFKIAGSGRKGPVLVDITKDVNVAEYEYTPAEAFKETKNLNINKDQLDQFLKCLENSEKPLICFGGGVVSSDSSELLYELIHKANIPAVHTVMGTGVLSWDDQLNMGMVGMHGFLSGNKALDEADLVIAVGFRFSDRVALNAKRFAPRAKIVQFEIDPSEINKNVHVDHAIMGDIGVILEQLIPQVPENQHVDWVEQIAQWKREDLPPKSSDTEIKPHDVIEAVCEMSGDDMIMVTDVGQHQMWAAQYCKRTKPRGFLTSGGLGTMGFGYGAAIGAQVAAPNSKVVHITGDACFHMNLNEACTAVSYNLPIISVILNNSVLGMVRQWQTCFYGERYSSTSPNRVTNYAKVAEGFGAKGYHCETIDEFKKAYAEALESKCPVWIECVIDENEMVLPMIPAGGTLDDVILDH